MSLGGGGGGGGGGGSLLRIYVDQQIIDTSSCYRHFSLPPLIHNYACETIHSDCKRRNNYLRHTEAKENISNTY